MDITDNSDSQEESQRRCKKSKVWEKSKGRGEFKSRGSNELLHLMQSRKCSEDVKGKSGFDSSVSSLLQEVPIEYGKVS